jgi:hypothetical protein
MIPWTRIFRDSSTSRTTPSGIPLPKFLNGSFSQVSSGSTKVWNLTLPPSRDRSELKTVRNPSTVSGTTFNFSPLIGAVRPPGQDARKQTRKLTVSQETELKMGVLLGRSPAGKQVLVNWAFGVMPFGLSLTGPDMSSVMRLLAVSDETSGSDRSEHMTVGLSDPLG